MTRTARSDDVLDRIFDAYVRSGRRQFWPSQFVGFQGMSIEDATAALIDLHDAGYLRAYVTAECQDGHEIWATRNPHELGDANMREALGYCPHCPGHHPGEVAFNFVFALEDRWMQRLKRQVHVGAN